VLSSVAAELPLLPKIVLSYPADRLSVAEDHLLIADLVVDPTGARRVRVTVNGEEVGGERGISVGPGPASQVGRVEKVPSREPQGRREVRPEVM
jgi:hypothetical protein